MTQLKVSNQRMNLARAIKALASMGTINLHTPGRRQTWKGLRMHIMYVQLGSNDNDSDVRILLY